MKSESKKEIKIGDIVKIRTWESMEKEYGLDEDGDIPVNPDTAFVGEMKPLCGLTAEVVNIIYDEDEKVIQLRFPEKEESEYDTRWWFTEEMFEQRRSVMTRKEQFEELITIISKSCKRHNIALSECEINLIAVDILGDRRAR